jgi:ribosomal protein S18 acetylase RimI-like enzyme
MCEMINFVLEIRLLRPDLEPALTVFFLTLANSESSRHFHPHPFTAQEATVRCRYVGADLYYAVINDNALIAYGMLRGWDEGLAVPSLGIAVDSAYRGKGVGELLMRFLHAAAKLRGAAKIRLKVEPENTAALALYRKLGYQFMPYLDDGQHVAYCDLAKTS